MIIAEHASDGIIILSKAPISGRNGILIAGSSGAENLEEIVKQARSDAAPAFLAEKNELYEVTDRTKRIPKSSQRLSEVVLRLCARHDFSYLAILRNGRIKILHEPDEIRALAEKYAAPSLPKSSRKKLLSEAENLISLYFSRNFLFRETRQNSILKRAQKIPEKSLISRIYGSLCKTDSNSRVLEELDRIYFRNKRQDIILDVRTDDDSRKNEIAHKLMRDLKSGQYIIFQNIPYIAVPCDIKDIDAACKALNNRNTKYLSAISRFKESVGKAERSKGCYYPELVFQRSPALDYSLSSADASWNLANIGAPQAWRKTKGNGAVVMVIDSGVDYRHDEIGACFSEKKGINFIAGNDDPMDDNGHGTHVAGIVAGHTTGVAPKAGLFAAKVLDRTGTGSNTDIIQAIDYAITNKEIDIINMSLGSGGYSYALDRICKKAYTQGLIICAAAGNEGFGASYPAACEGVISVAAVDHNNKHARFSNIHTSVDISCPGVSIMSSFPGNGYRELSGTSMATPHVAGVAALAVSTRKELQNSVFEEALKNTAQLLGSGETHQQEKYGAGLARADAIVDKLYKSLFTRVKPWR